jgi:hypothetical protein
MIRRFAAALLIVGGLMTDAQADRSFTLAVPLAIGKETLPHTVTARQLRDAVDRFNHAGQRFNRELDELQALNPQWLSADEVLLFVEHLPRLPADLRKTLAAAAPLDLSAPALKLYCADGFGRHGLQGHWRLVAARAGDWQIEPAVDPADVVADLALATAAEARRQTAHDDASTRLLAAAPDSPDYAPAFQAESQARARLTWLRRTELALLDLLRPALTPSATVGGYTLARVDAERARLAAELSGAPLGGGLGMPGPGSPPPGSLPPPPK